MRGGNFWKGYRVEEGVVVDAVGVYFKVGVAYAGVADFGGVGVPCVVVAPVVAHCAVVPTVGFWTKIPRVRNLQVPLSAPFHRSVVEEAVAVNQVVVCLGGGTAKLHSPHAVLFEGVLEDDVFAAHVDVDA